MTVSSEVKRSDFAGNGSTTAFATGFRFLQNSDIKVILTVDATGVETVQVEITNYTLTGAGLDAGGTVTMLIAPPTGTTLTIKRDVPLTQGTDYIENDDFPAESHEEALDKLTMITQQIQEELDRSLKLSEAQQSSGLTLPVPVTNRFLQWDVNGDLQNVDIALQGALAVSDFAKTYLDDLTAAATRTTLGAAAIVSPTFTGIPAAPTASLGTNTTQLGTTAFVQAALPPTASIISALIPSNAADADHDITISTGSARDSGDTKTLKLTSAITKQLDAAFVAGNNAGGLFTGTIAADTTYHLFIIEKDSDGSIDAGFDTSLTAANIPTGFTAFRRISSFITDSSSNLIGFNAVEAAGGSLDVMYDVRLLDISNTAPGTSANLVTLTVPVDIILQVKLIARLNQAADVEIIFTEVNSDDVAPVANNADLRVRASSVLSSINFLLKTNISGQIRFRSSVGTGLSAFRVSTLGYLDYRR